MAMKRLLAAAVAIAALLWYLRDPAWLDGMTSGLRPWEQHDGVRYRWSGGHASFFVPSSAAIIDVPVSTTFASSDRPMAVSFAIDDRPAGRVLLTDARWQVVSLHPSAATTRHVRRIDVRTNIVRDDNHGVRIGAIAARSASLGSTR